MTEISVVIPSRISCHHKLSIFRKALNSLLHQTIKVLSYEVIIIDDGSKIELKKELSDFLDHTESIKLFKQSEKGPAAARNIGIRLSQGEIILFIGDDVVVQNNLLEMHLKAHAAGENIIVINPLYAPEKTLLGKDIIEMRLEDFDEGVRYQMPTGWAFCTACVSVKKQLISQAMFDENFLFAAYEDTEVGYRLYQKGVEFMVIKNTSAIHEHIYTLDKLRARSRACGYSFIYLANKHPQLNIGFKCNPLSPDFVIKKYVYGALSVVLNGLYGLLSGGVRAWGISMLCKYDFIKGAKEGFKHSRTFL